MAKSSRIQARWAAAVPVLALSGVSFAGSQFLQTKVEKPWRVSIGATRLISGDLSDAVGRNGYEFGLGYQLGTFNVSDTLKANYFIDLSWGRHEDNSTRLDSLDVALTGRTTLSTGKSGSFYGGLGVGVAFIKAEYPGSNQSNSGGGGNYQVASFGRVVDVFSGTSSSSEKYTRAFTKLILGYEFKQGAFIEASYKIVGSIDGASPNTLGLAIGFKF